jgi:hypothetical protein
MYIYTYVLYRLESQLEAASAMIQKQSLTLQKTIERMAEDKKISESSILKLESQIVSSDERYDMIRSERDNLLSLNSGYIYICICMYVYIHVCV